MTMHLRQQPLDETFQRAERNASQGQRITDAAHLTRLAKRVAAQLDTESPLGDTRNLVGHVLPLIGIGPTTGPTSASPPVIKLETLLTDQSLSLIWTKAPGSGSALIAGIKLLLADGRPLPRWAKRLSSGAYFPSALQQEEELKFQMTVTYVDGTYERHIFSVAMAAGQITATQEVQSPTALIFADQVDSATNGQVKALQAIGEQLRAAHRQDTTKRADRSKAV